MKKLFIAIIGLMALAQATNAQEKKEFYGVANHLSLGVGAGTEGVSVDLSTCFCKYLSLRAGVNFVPGINITEDIDVEGEFHGHRVNSDLDIDASLKRTTFDVKLDFYPFPNSSSFFLSAGASFGGEKLATLSGHSDEAEKYINQLSDMGKYEGNYYINIDDETRIPIDRNGNATGRVEVSKVRPYVGLGFGRHTPGKRIGMRIELGAQFHGTPNIVADNAIGNINSAIKGEVDNDLVEIIDKMVVYPVLKLTLCGRIF